MLSDKDIYIRREQYQDLQREIEHDLLVAQALRSRDRTDGLFVRLLAWLGRGAGTLVRHRQPKRSNEAQNSWTTGAGDDENKLIPLGGHK